ncbi:MAG: HAMP domain-containing sensor histidine kinase [Eubacteriales bacterium]|nr:HAMP domain-containing sensor histidine kinase [Eubacteriales bacterium]
MKKTHSNLHYALLLLLLYIAGLLIGYCLFWQLPAYKQLTQLQTKARSLAQEYSAVGAEAIVPIDNVTIHIAVFNAEKECIYFYASGEEQLDALNAIDANVLKRIQNNLDSLMAGKETSYVTLNFYDDAEYRGALGIVGVPLLTDGSVTGALFLFRNYFTIYSTFVIFLYAYTILYALFCAWAIFRIKKKRYQEEVDRFKRNYVDNVTHALKTPVSAIRTLAESLCDEVVPDPERQKLYCSRILLEVKKQERMIRDILKLSEIQNCQMDFSKTALSFAQCFRNVLDCYAELCEYMEISVHMPEDLEQLPMLYTNAACMEEVLKTLLDNAMKFTPEGGDIWVEVRQQKNRLVLCVRDNGVSIPQKDQAQIFERFFKGSAPGNENGSGLGLAIAKEILDGLQEKIWVESEPEKGAAFSFTIAMR